MQSRALSPNFMRHLANHVVPPETKKGPQVQKPQLVYRNENGTPFRSGAPSCSITSKDVSEYFLREAARHLVVDLEKVRPRPKLPDDEPAAAPAAEASKPEEHAKSAHSKKATKGKKKGGNGKKKRK